MGEQGAKRHAERCFFRAHPNVCFTCAAKVLRSSHHTLAYARVDAQVANQLAAMDGTTDLLPPGEPSRLRVALRVALLPARRIVARADASLLRGATVHGAVGRLPGNAVSQRHHDVLDQLIECTHTQANPAAKELAACDPELSAMSHLYHAFRDELAKAGLCMVSYSAFRRMINMLQLRTDFVLSRWLKDDSAANCCVHLRVRARGRLVCFRARLCARPRCRARSTRCICWRTTKASLPPSAPRRCPCWRRRRRLSRTT